MLALLAQGSGLGFGAGTAFGPLHNLLLNVTLTRGWRYGLLVVITPLLTDIPIILLMLFLLEQLPPELVRLLPLIGGVFILWLAWGAWRQFRNPPQIDAARSGDTNISRETILKGMMVNFLNPAPYIFWGAAGGTILRDGLEQSIGHGAAFLLGFYLVFLGIMAVLVVVFDRLRQMDARITRGLSLISVVVMTLLGIQLILQGLSG
ncbi:MAG: LysE family transporter [Anaerolineae bacterium]|nr:LysE family transporter [Anaerolineae bacterium]